MQKRELGYNGLINALDLTGLTIDATISPVPSSPSVPFISGDASNDHPKGDKDGEDPGECVETVSSP